MGPLIFGLAEGITKAKSQSLVAFLGSYSAFLPAQIIRFGLNRLARQ